MSTATRTASSFALPAELHLEVYKHMLADIAEDPCPHELAPYAGLLLSCKQIKFDFEHEFAKDFNKYLERLLTYPEVYSNSTHSLTTWRARPVKTFHDATHVRIIVAYNMDEWDSGDSCYVMMRLMRLMAKFRSFTVCLDTSYPAYDGTVRGFWESERRDHLKCMRATFQETWIDWHYDYFYPQERPDAPKISCRMNFWASEIHDVVPFTVMVPPLDSRLNVDVDLAGYDSKLDDDVEVVVSTTDAGSDDSSRNIMNVLPPDVKLELHHRIFESCTTMAELKQYSGWTQVSREVQEYFEAALAAWLSSSHSQESMTRS
jgi:hypothetical protein